MKLIIITILIYSLILSIITIYKDNSSYYMVGDLDIIAAGPVLWVIRVFIVIFSPILIIICDKKKEQPYKKKSAKYISKVVKKVVTNFKKTTRDKNTFFNLVSRFGDSAGYKYEGYDYLLVSKERYEWTNKKFKRLIYLQREETLHELEKYFRVVTEEERDNLYIPSYDKTVLYVLKGENDHE